MQDLLVFPDQTDSLGAMGKLDSPDLQGHLVHQDQLDRQDNQETPDSPDNLDRKESAVSAPNIVRWMEVCSSKMERDDKKTIKQIASGAIYLYVCNKRLSSKSFSTGVFQDSGFIIIGWQS